MRRPLTDIRLSKVNIPLLVAGAALVLVALLSRWVTIGSNQIDKTAPWWVPVVVGAVGALAIAWGVAAGRKQLPELRTARGFLGAPPKMPDPQRLVSRPTLSQQVAEALRVGGGTVALTGIGGAGKSTLAAGACLDRRVGRRFRDGVTWLEASPGQDPVALLAGLGRRLGLPKSKSGFTTVKKGRDEIANVLRGKRMLIGVDNVSEPEPLEALTGLAPGCTVLFTTRRADLATTHSTTTIPVDKLTSEEALELLGRWAGQAPTELPAAQALCARVGNLALGVAMAGAMVAQGRFFSDVLALIEQDPARVHADLDPAYPYQNLRAAIEAGISDLTETAQHQYEQLAVFAGRGPFPREAAGALWRPDLTEAEVGDLLADLASRSLLTAAGKGWYAAHDLQYDVLKRRLGRDGLAAAHARLLEGYRTRYPGGWASSAADPYLARALAGHLHNAARDDELRAFLLADVAWIQARIAAGQLPDLLADYGYVSDPASQQIARALRLSAHSLAADPGQVPGQLAGRLLSHPHPAIADWATAVTNQDRPGPWLAPLTPGLTPTTTGLEQVLTGHDGMARSVAVTADGATAVSGGDDSTVRVWDLATGRQRAELTGHADRVLTVAVTADGATAVSGGDDGTVRVWDLATGHLRAELTGHAGWVGSVAVTADGTTAISGGGGTVQVWDLATGHLRAELTGHAGWVELAVTADGTRAVSGGAGGKVRVWDLATGHLRAELTGHVGPDRSVAVTADGATAVSGDADGTVRVWDLATGRLRAELTGHGGPAYSPFVTPVNSVAVTADGTTAVSGGEDGTVRVWDLATSREKAKFTHPFLSVRSVAVTADGTTAVSGGADGTVWVWDLTDGYERAELTGHDGPVWSVAVTADGTTAVSGGTDDTARVWDLATGRQRAELTGHDGPVRSVAVTADGTTAVSGGADGTVRVWDLATGRQRAKLTGHTRAVNSVAITADGTRAVSGSDDGTVRVWDLVTGRQLERVELTGHGVGSGVWVVSVAVTADGTTAVTDSSDGAVRVWDLATGRQRAELTGHDDPAYSVAVTADGTTAVTGSDDGTVRIWDLATGRQLERVELTSDTRAVMAVAITADGATAVTATDRTVRVWDLAARIELASWIGDFNVVACTVLPGRPLKFAVGQERGQPYLLELRGQHITT
jgi:WD40 repeat protein